MLTRSTTRTMGTRYWPVLVGTACRYTRCGGWMSSKRIMFSDLPCFRGLGERAPSIPVGKESIIVYEKEIPTRPGFAPARPFILGKLSAEKLPGRYCIAEFCASLLVLVPVCPTGTVVDSSAHTRSSLGWTETLLYWS